MASSPAHRMAMATLKGGSILQQNLTNCQWIALGQNSRSFRRAPAFRSPVILPGSCISVSSLTTRVRIPRRQLLCVSKAGEEGGADGSQQEKVESTNNSTTTSVVGGGGGAKGFGAPSKAATTEKSKSSKSASGSVRRPPPSKPLIGVSTEDRQTQQVETAVVGSLVFLFAVIFLEGVFLAASGFLPEEWDEFAVNAIYPAFTPSVGVFLAIAASYGLWKTLGGGPGTTSR